MHRLRTVQVVFFFFMFVGAPGAALAVVQQQSTDEQVLPGRIYVHFADDHQRFSVGRTGIESFDRKASRYSVTAIEKAFPSLEVIAARRPLSPATRHCDVSMSCIMMRPTLRGRLPGI